jgi:hypothetical protein
MMHDSRGLNFGPSYAYVHGTGGATTSSVLVPGDQIDQLVAQVQSGDVTLALMSIGDNDWFTVAGSIANGSLSGPALQTFQNNLVTNITTGVDAVLAAGGKVVLGSFSNITDAPAAAAIYANPVARANLEGALAAADDQLRAYAVSHGVPFVDFFALQKMVYDSGSFVIGGVPISLTTVGPDPHNFFQSSLNAGLAIRGEIANLWIQAINQGYGTNIPLLTDLEILTIAGLQDEYQGETFGNVTNFASFVSVPEPSTFALTAILLIAVLAHRARRHGIGR